MSYTENFSFAKGESTQIERKVKKVIVSTGSILVSDGENGKQVGEGKDFDTKESTTVTITALEPSNGAIEFVENPVVAPRPILGQEDIDNAQAERDAASKEEQKDADEASPSPTQSPASASKSTATDKPKSDKKSTAKKG